MKKELESFVFECPECGRKGKITMFFTSGSFGRSIANVGLVCRNTLCYNRWSVSIEKSSG
jgi:hypothetical protein